MCSLQCKGLFGEVGFEFEDTRNFRPPITIDAEDVRQELEASINREAEAEDLILGTYQSPLFSSAEELKNPKNAFSTPLCSWPYAVREEELLSAPDPVRDLDAHHHMLYSLDEEGKDYVKTTCEPDAPAQYYLDKRFRKDFWEEKEELFGGKEGEGDAMLQDMEKNTKGLTPPGYSAPLLIDVVQDIALCGAAASSTDIQTDIPSTSIMRNSEVKYYTSKKDEIENFARGFVKKERPQKVATLKMLNDEDEAKLAQKEMELTDTSYKCDWASEEKLDVSEFSTLVPDPAVQYPFELDDFQKQSIARIEMNQNVFVAAHTSAGKTAVAEYAIGLALKKGSRVIYTSPLKTLSNQKYYDFRQRFGSDVGILTGDVQINPQASCLIMTTEILRSALYQNHNQAMSGITGMESLQGSRSDMLCDVDYVVFDEIHYLNDPNRGYVWEEVIILLPKRIKLIMLSATVFNLHDFASWIGRVRESMVYISSTDKRPVPLRQSILLGENEFLLHEGEGDPSQESYNKFVAQVQGQKDRKSHHRFSEAQQWKRVINFLSKKKRLPAIVFTFSKNRITAITEALSSTCLTTKQEKAAIEKFLRDAMVRLHGYGTNIPQVQRLFFLLRNGIALHHSGLMPLLKEIVERLFCMGLIKVLFATETFAMGVNAPAKTVVFAETSKFSSGGSKRPLKGSEYIQMAGRAGRRGLDTVGHVYLFASTFRSAGVDGFVANIPDYDTLRAMTKGKHDRITSKFRLTYTMVINCLMSSHPGSNGKATSSSAFITHLLRNSYSESVINAMVPVYATLQEKYQKEAEECKTTIDSWTEENSERKLAAYENARLIVQSCKKLVFPLLRERTVPKALVLGSVVVVEILPMAFTLGYVLRMSSTDQIELVVVLDESSEYNRSYSQTAFLVPTQVIESGNLDIVTLPRRNIVAILDQKFNVTNVDTRRTAPVEMRQLKKKDDDDMFMGSKKGGKKSAPAPVVVPRVTQEKVSLQDKPKLLDLGKKLFDILKKGIQMEDVCLDSERLGITSSPDVLSLREEVQHKVSSFNDYGEIVGEDMDLAHRHYVASKKAKLYSHLASDDALYLLPEFHGRVRVLQELGMVQPEDDSLEVFELLPKGLCASVIVSMDSVIATELIFDGFFDDLTVEQCAAALSCFICNERRGPNEAPTELKQMQEKIEATLAGLWEIQSDWLQEGLEEYIESNVTYAICEAVWEWAHGTPFVDILTVTKAYEGTLIRDITRIDNLTREIFTAARYLGDTPLQDKMAECSVLIRRDTIFCQSLYLD